MKTQHSQGKKSCLNGTFYVYFTTIVFLFCFVLRGKKNKTTDLGIKKGKILMGSSIEACPNHSVDIQSHLTSLVAQMVKRLPTMWETWVQSLGWEDLLEKEMSTHSSTLVWKIP